jgi:predicted PurR-regulated permease PerM
MYSIRRTLFLFIVALLFAYLLLPVVDFIDRVLPMRGLRTPSLAIVYVPWSLAPFTASRWVWVTDQAQTLSQKVSDYLKPEQARTCRCRKRSNRWVTGFCPSCAPRCSSIISRYRNLPQTV